MKKTYVKPSMAVIKMESSCQLLTGTVDPPRRLPDNYEEIKFTDEIITDPA